MSIDRVRIACRFTDATLFMSVSKVRYAISRKWTYLFSVFREIALLRSERSHFLKGR